MSKRQTPEDALDGPAEAGRLPDPALIHEALGYVPTVARRYLGHGLDWDELVAAGNLGLVEAALRYDASRNVKFVTYADWWIRKAVFEALESQAGPVRLPRYRHDRRRQLQRARARWIARHGISPTREQLASTSGLSAAEVESVLRVPVRASLEQPAGRGGERSLGETLPDPSGEGPQGELLRRDLAAHVMRLVSRLEERESAVIVLRFGLDGDSPMTLRGTGRRLGLSRERVRQIELRALVKLRALLRDGCPAECPMSEWGAR